VTIEEQKLSETLHRLTPEPPRPVTVEDIAIRLANKNAPARRAGRGVTRMSGGQMSGTRPDADETGSWRPRRGRLTPLLAAAAVVVIAGGGAGVAVALSSHTSKVPAASGGATAAATGQGSTAPASPAQSASTAPSTAPVASGQPITNGAWGASVVASVSLTAGTLVSGGNSLYAFNADNLLEIDPSTGQTTHEAPSDGFPGQAPVIAGNKVWEITNYGDSVTLSGYGLSTLSAGGTINVPASGPVSSSPEGILTAEPNGNLYLAAGSVVAEVNPSTRAVVHQFTVPGGAADSVAVSPDGSRIYVASGSRLLELNGSSGAEVASATMSAQTGGALVATSDGVWFTTGGDMAERVWFAPVGNLSGARVVAGPADGGAEAVPTYADGIIWVGGTQKVECLSPVSGQLMASSLVPSDDQVPESIGDFASADGHMFALYVNNRTQATGVAVLSPPPSCGIGTTSPGGTGS
jgi:WD40 repeat protein